MIEKIRSGGQTGADQEALDAAIKLGITHVRRLDYIHLFWCSFFI
jgi:putative molybdenum carrier protein